MTVWEVRCTHPRVPSSEEAVSPLVPRCTCIRASNASFPAPLQLHRQVGGGGCICLVRTRADGLVALVGAELVGVVGIKAMAVGKLDASREIATVETGKEPADEGGGLLLLIRPQETKA